MTNKNREKKKMIPFLIIAVGVTIGTVIFVFANSNQPNEQTGVDGEQSLDPNLLDTIEISVLAVGLIISSVMTGLGLRYTAKESSAARKERNLSLVGSFSSQLTALKDKERNLKSQKDCETYAQNFVDLVDQIAYLYVRGSLPDDVADFFENELSYALTMIEWMNREGIEKKLIVIPTNNMPEFIRKGEPPITFETIDDYSTKKETLTTDIRIINYLKYENCKTVEIKEVLKSPEKYQIDKQYPWTSLVERCIQKSIVPFEIEQQLPETMRKYSSLPSDEQDKIMDVINQYSAQITELKSNEKSLTTKNDCETYASNFVDLMDQIAFLYDKNTFPPDTHEYFINDFEYALRMIVWLENNGAACELKKAIFKNNPSKIHTKDSDWKDLMQQYQKNKKIIEDEEEKYEPFKEKIEKLENEIKKIDFSNKNLKKKLGEDLEKAKKIYDVMRQDRQKEYSWDSLIKLSDKNSYDPLDHSTLPIPMQEYDQLPDEEMDKTLDLIKDYGDRISKLTLREQNLDQERDVNLACELYANSYIDLLDNIAFLHNKKALPEKVAKYFENNFCYALTLVKYLVDTNVAEQKYLPIVLTINKKQIEFAKMTCDLWLNKDVPKNWIRNNIKKIGNSWITKNMKTGILEGDDLLNWAREKGDILQINDDNKWNNITKSEQTIICNEFIKKTKLDLQEKINSKIRPTWEDLREIIDLGDQYTWTDLMLWCKENKLTPYDKKQLPPIMRSKKSLKK